MQGRHLSRRGFLAGAVAGGALLRAGLPAVAALSASACTARDEEAAFRVLATAEAREFEAIAARILPTTDTPGAREAGVIWFIDQAFDSIMKGSLDFARTGLQDFQTGVADAAPGASRFSDLDEQAQDEYLAKRQDSPFFGLMHFLTVAGFFGMSSYGGNRDNVGWKLLGFDPRHVWEPPFGHYDTQYARGDGDGD
jgi:gluconate 2-dehydrogenase gamma chain